MLRYKSVRRLTLIDTQTHTVTIPLPQSPTTSLAVNSFSCVHIKRITIITQLIKLN